MTSPPDVKHITFTPELRDKLRQQYQDAVKKGDQTFTFEGHPMVVGYVKYLLEYLDEKLASNGNWNYPL